MNDIAIKSTNFKHIDKLVIILHGYGNSGSDYIKIGKTFLTPNIDNAVFLFPDAPTPCATWTGQQWFPLSLENMSFEEIRNGLDQAAPHLCKYIETKSQEFRCNNVCLVGISQGAIMALEMMYYTKIFKIVVCCGLFAPNSYKKNRSTPDILLIHSVDDNIIPYKKALLAKSDLEKMELKVSLHTCHNIRHSISKEGWQIGAEFLNEYNNIQNL